MSIHLFKVYWLGNHLDLPIMSLDPPIIVLYLMHMVYTGF
jgi:hypothetical protein